jgi:hypothetical protein
MEVQFIISNKFVILSPTSVALHRYIFVLGTHSTHHNVVPETTIVSDQHFLQAKFEVLVFPKYITDQHFHSQKMYAVHITAQRTTIIHKKLPCPILDLAHVFSD